eukprot:6933786-Alexandrium_andersonii.AAC.1
MLLSSIRVELFCTAFGPTAVAAASAPAWMPSSEPGPAAPPLCRRRRQRRGRRGRCFSFQGGVRPDQALHVGSLPCVAV